MRICWAVGQLITVLPESKFSQHYFTIVNLLFTILSLVKLVSILFSFALTCYCWRSSVVVSRLGCRTHDRNIVSSTPGVATLGK